MEAKRIGEALVKFNLWDYLALPIIVFLIYLALRG